jgi:hypothetical protein
VTTPFTLSHLALTGGLPMSHFGFRSLSARGIRPQGSSVGFSETGDDSETGPAVLIGEGGYEGLTAIMVTSIEGDCFLNVRGFVTSVPAMPAPVTEE